MAYGVKNTFVEVKQRASVAVDDFGGDAFSRRQTEPPGASQPLRLYSKEPPRHACIGATAEYTTVTSGRVSIAGELTPKTDEARRVSVIMPMVSQSSYTAKRQSVHPSGVAMTKVISGGHAMTPTASGKASEGGGSALTIPTDLRMRRHLSTNSNANTMTHQSSFGASPVSGRRRLPSGMDATPDAYWARTRAGSAFGIPSGLEQPAIHNYGINLNQMPTAPIQMTHLPIGASAPPTTMHTSPAASLAPPPPGAAVTNPYSPWSNMPQQFMQMYHGAPGMPPMTHPPMPGAGHGYHSTATATSAPQPLELGKLVATAPVTNLSSSPNMVMSPMQAVDYSPGMDSMGLEGGYQPDGEHQEGITTVMLRNIPVKYNREMMLGDMDNRGFRCTYDFFYLPIDFQTGNTVGYAFINFIHPNEAQRFREIYSGLQLSPDSTKICEVGVAKAQGKAKNVEQYRNSSVMAMEERFKPVIFEKGARAPFPPPTRMLKPVKPRQKQ